MSVAEKLHRIRNYLPFRFGQFMRRDGPRLWELVEVRANKHSTECMCINFRSEDSRRRRVCAMSHVWVRLCAVCGKPEWVAHVVRWLSFNFADTHAESRTSYHEENKFNRRTNEWRRRECERSNDYVHVARCIVISIESSRNGNAHHVMQFS